MVMPHVLELGKMSQNDLRQRGNSGKPGTRVDGKLMADDIPRSLAVTREACVTAGLGTLWGVSGERCRRLLGSRVAEQICTSRILPRTARTNLGASI